ncbi:21390_t:CDS:1, partial [Cetraspora pellucida]
MQGFDIILGILSLLRSATAQQDKKLIQQAIVQEIPTHFSAIYVEKI